MFCKAKHSLLWAVKFSLRGKPPKKRGPVLFKTGPLYYVSRYEIRYFNQDTPAHQREMSWRSQEVGIMPWFGSIFVSAGGCPAEPIPSPNIVGGGRPTMSVTKRFYLYLKGFLTTCQPRQMWLIVR